MKNPSKWEYYVHLIEFSYNNRYHTSTKMSPFKVLYGQKCERLATWDSLMDKLMLGPVLLKYLEQVVTKVQQNLK